jgi:hypothetical protein
VAGALSFRRANGTGGSSVRRTKRRTLDPQQLQQAVDLRHQRGTLRRIARLLLVPISSLARAMPHPRPRRLDGLRLDSQAKAADHQSPLE